MNLNRKDLENYRFKIAKQCRIPAVDVKIMQNGTFTISDLSSSDADRIVYILKNQDYINSLTRSKVPVIKSSDLWKLAAYPGRDLSRFNIHGSLKETLIEDYGDYGYGYSRYDLISRLKKLGYNYKWDKYSDAQLYHMLNWAETKKSKIEKENQEAAEETAKLYSLNKKQINLDWYNQYKGYDIYIDKNTNAFSIEGIEKIFNSEQEVINYIDSLIDDEPIMESKKKKKKNWYNMLIADGIKKTQSAIMSTAGTAENIAIINHNLGNNDISSSENNVTDNGTSSGGDCAVASGGE